MNDPIELPEELAFLHWVSDTNPQKYQKANWLISDFHATSWVCKFNSNNFTVNWDITLKNGKSLVKDYSETLVIFKTWLTVQGHPDATGGRSNLPIVTFHKCSDIFRLIDFIILNEERYEILENGVSGLLESDLKSIFVQICSQNIAEESIYKWSTSLTEFAKSCIKEVPRKIKKEIMFNNPEILHIDVIKMDRLLDLSDEQIISFRVWLLWKGLYSRGSTNSDFQYVVSTTKLVQLVYPQTIWAEHTNFSSVSELSFSPIERYYREFEAVAVRTGLEKKVNSQRIDVLRASIKSLGLLANVGLPVPIDALEQFGKVSWLSTIDTKASGRFSSFPQEIVLMTLRKSIDFFIDYGEDLVDAYLKIAGAAKAENLNMQAFSGKNDITLYISEKLRNLGVKTWSLAQKMSLDEANPSRHKSERAPASTYFSRMRASEGLFELIQVLYGSIELSIGTLSARRQAELMELLAFECLDNSNKYLIFYNRKSGMEELRERELRPIPPIIVKMIWLIQRLHKGLTELGLLEGSGRLLSSPHRTLKRLRLVSPMTYNNPIDRACDYFEVGVNEKGERYYLRQHLLRRFFATLFFWGKSFGGMDTLRWFLGHTDVQHLYHYITESTSGEVLRWTKAQYVSNEVKQDSSDIGDLKALLIDKFKTSNFSILDSDELTAYIDSMLHDGAITVEPYFFQDEFGNDFKIVVKVIERSK